jgi:cation diffusion facilitator CzcD-associated flavoprotein CzcO
MHQAVKGAGQRRGAADYDVVVIGCGFAGIGAGIRLKEAGIHSFLLLEGEGDLGGTWRDNHYPGTAVDIPSLTYSFSFEPNPNWSRVFAPGDELYAYARHCVDKYELRPHIRFKARVTQIVFDEERHVWKITLGSGEPIEARFVLSATGLLTQPKIPNIQGVDSFEGAALHTARWNHDLVLEGKRVAVIGTGATAVQLVPSIAPRVERLHVFQRTPAWVLPKPDLEIPDAVKSLYRYLPLTQSSARLLTTVATELTLVLGVVHGRQTRPLLSAFEQLCLRHLRKQVADPTIRRKLTPTYGIGCKRPTLSNDYLRAFNRDNVELVTDPIERLTPRSIVTRDGTDRAIDILLFATGFKAFEEGNIPTYKVYGRGGLELGQFWAQHRYQAYQGASVPGFPNYFLIIGPYTTTGASWFAMIESQMAHIMRCIEHARETAATWIEIRRDVHEAYFEEIKKRHRDTVFYNNNCMSSNSFYFDKHGDVPHVRPSSGLEMWLRSRLFPLGNYCFAR